MESEDWRPPQDWGREPRHICDPGECVWPGVTVCSGPPRAGARKDEAAQHLGGCFLSLLLISDMGFNPSTVQCFLSSGDPAVLYIYIFFFLLALILLAITAVPGSYLWLL